MKAYKIFIILFLALAINACQDKETMNLTPAVGEEVQFGLSLGRGALSRTVYGPRENNVYPIYWIKGDKVVVSAPDCMAGRDTAVYSVNVPEVDLSKLNHSDYIKNLQNYADALDKVNAAGIQWGENLSSKFYSIYPASNVCGVNGSKFTLNMPDYQELTYKSGYNVLIPEMDGCFMSAVTEKAVASGSKVQLFYTPLSTAVRFKVSGYDAAIAGGDVEIRSVRLVAPKETKISGEFTIDLEDGDIQINDSKAYNYVHLDAAPEGGNGNIKISQNSSIEYNAFIIPQDDLSLNGWYIEITTDQKVQKISLTSGNLDARKVNCMTKALPNLVKPENKSDWDPANWMKNIPRNVYLSELTIPGSWNSLNKDFQEQKNNAAATIAAQYSSGVRAFHLDTRWKKVNNNYVIAIADGGTTSGGDGAKLSTGATVESVLQELITKVNTDTHEYILVFCSFAQGSYNGGDWVAAVSTAVDNVASNVNYGDYFLDGKTVDKNTTVFDALGKVLVIINCDNNITKDTSLPSNSKCLFVYSPLILTEARFPSDGFNEDALWKSSSSSSSSSSIGITLANSIVQATSNGNAISADDTEGRGYLPTIAQRDAVINAILTWSSSNYGSVNYNHDKWILLGLGGYYGKKNSALGSWLGSNIKEVDGSKNTIAQKYAELITGKITAMENNSKFYPLGITFLNYTTSNDYSKGCVRELLELNKKYRLQYDATKPAFPDYETNPASEIDPLNSTYNSSMKVDPNGSNVFDL